MSVFHFRTETSYYVDANGRKTDEVYCIKAAVKCLLELYSLTLAIEFGPLSLKAVQARMVAAGMSRGTVNRHIHRVRRIFKWAVSEQILPVDVYQSLLTVDGLRVGRTKARETEPVQPVPDSVVEETLPFRNC